MILGHPSVDVDGSAATTTQIFDFVALWSVYLQSLFSSSVASTTPMTKVWCNSVHWFIGYRANKTPVRTHSRTDNPKTMPSLQLLVVGGGIKNVSAFKKPQKHWISFAQKLPVDAFSSELMDVIKFARFSGSLFRAFDFV